MLMRVAALILAPTLAVLLVACDGTDESPPTATRTPAAATPPAATDTSTPAQIHGNRHTHLDAHASNYSHART